MEAEEEVDDWLKEMSEHVNDDKEPLVPEFRRASRIPQATIFANGQKIVLNSD
jgi:hypothetical protein